MVSLMANQTARRVLQQMIIEERLQGAEARAAINEANRIQNVMNSRVSVSFGVCCIINFFYYPKSIRTTARHPARCLCAGAAESVNDGRKVWLVTCGKHLLSRN